MSLKTWRRCLALVTLMTLLTAPLARAEDLVSEIQHRGTLRVGMAESPPWQAPDPSSGQYEGFNVDLANRVAKIMGVKLQIVPATWATLIPGLQAKQYDAVFANLFATPERALAVNFTQPYETYGFLVVVGADSKVKSLAQLNSPDVTFVGMSGTVEEQYPHEAFPKAKVRGIVTNDIGAWIGEVAGGQADAAFLDPGTFQILKARNPNFASALRVLNDEHSLLKPVGLAYAVRPEPDDAHMLQFLNTFIADFVRNGDSTKLRDEWFAKQAQEK